MVDRAIRPTRLYAWAAASAAAVIIVLGLGLGLVALVAMTASPRTLTKWSNAGQAFGVLTAVFSGFALAALVITFLMQLQELKTQRIELTQQRKLLAQAQAALHGSSEADLRARHIDLIRMAITDPVLAEVWPQVQPNLQVDRNRQYLYANLVIQHTGLHHKVMNLSAKEVRSLLRYLFTSSLIREFWAATQASRASFLTPGSPESEFTRIADEVFRESRRSNLPHQEES